MYYIARLNDVSSTETRDKLTMENVVAMSLSVCNTKIPSSNADLHTSTLFITFNDISKREYCLCYTVFTDVSSFRHFPVPALYFNFLWHITLQIYLVQSIPS
jgi:hypothetical protein